MVAGMTARSKDKHILDRVPMGIGHMNERPRGIVPRGSALHSRTADLRLRSAGAQPSRRCKPSTKWVRTAA